MLELAAVESGNCLHQRRGGTFDVRVTGIGSECFSARLIFVELNVEGRFDVGDRPLGTYVEVVGTDAQDLQIVRLEKILNRLRLRGRGCKARGDVGTLQPASVIGGMRVVYADCQTVQLGAVAWVQPDAYFDGLRGIGRTQVLGGGNVGRRVMGDELAIGGTGWDGDDRHSRHKNRHEA